MTDTPVQPIKPIKRPADLIYQCIVDLCATNRIASRQIISNMTGLKMTIVDDHIKTMIADHRLRRVVNGIVEPMEDAALDRSISVTYLASGGIKFEIGDECLYLTFREAVNVEAALAGAKIRMGR